MEKINELIQQHFELKVKLDELQQKDEAIRTEIKVRLKQDGKEYYEDPEGNTVTYKEYSREGLDKKKVKELLGAIQFKEVLKVTTFESLKIISKENREKIKTMLEKKY